MDTQQLIAELFHIGAIKKGDFTLKSGQKSNVYVDLRELVSHPSLIQSVAKLFWETLEGLPHNVLCGVPYTALPLATALSLEHNIPMLMQRKEKKDYGTKKMIEGNIIEGQSCIIIEDVVTTGGSVLNSCQLLREQGLHVAHVLVVVDREQGARQVLEEQGLKLHSLITLENILNYQ